MNRFDAASWLNQIDFASSLPSPTRILFWVMIAVLGVGVAQLSTRLGEWLFPDDVEEPDEDSEDDQDEETKA